MINNKDTDWGNNESSRGIDVASMSFGSLSSPLNPDDEGDNGSGGEARLVNDARDAGIVCVVAMGNDGTKRVPSPATARTVPFLSALSTTETPSTGPTISSPHTPTTAHASMTGMTMSGMN